MNSKLLDKLQKVLALTTSPIEGEAAAAMATLQRLLAQHNLDIADLEQRGASSAPQISEKHHDLGKAAFTWKMDLAEAVAGHFFCVALVNRRYKTVQFVGRPDNVDSMKALYAWMIDQIRRICSVRRKEYLEENPGAHIDPLRWQVQFGVGIVSRLGERLEELKRSQQDAAGSALVIHHDTEISDYLEAKYGYRTDGKDTQRTKEWRERRAKEQAELEELKATDLEAYYARCPDARPLTEKEAAKKAKEEAKRDAQWEAKWKRQMERDERRERNKSPEELRKEREGRVARRSGAESAKDINLEPFLTSSDAPHGTTRI